MLLVAFNNKMQTCCMILTESQIEGWGVTVIEIQSDRL